MVDFSPLPLTYTSSIQTNWHYSGTVLKTRNPSDHSCLQCCLVNFTIAMQSYSSKLAILLPLLFCIGTDQWTKSAMMTLLEAGETLYFAGGLIQVSLIKNYDGFLGVAAPLSAQLRNALLLGGVALLIIGCLAYLFSSKPSAITVPLIFVTGGGSSNLLDRVVYNGGVTDFLSIGVGTIRTGIFNLADIYILAGSAVLGYRLFSRTSTGRNPDLAD